MTLPPSIAAALFDLDGTLIETHIDFTAMRSAMREMALGAGVPEEVIANHDILGIVEAASTEIALAGGNGEEYRRGAFGILEEMEVEGCSNPKLLPGAQEWLADLRAGGVKVAIVTRNCRRVSEPLLARFDIGYDLLLTRDDVRRTKPDPDHLHAAVATLGETPDQAIMVGDHWMDIQAGKAAGVALTVGVLGNRDPDWFAPCPPDVVVRDLAEARVALPPAPLPQRGEGR